MNDMKTNKKSIFLLTGLILISCVLVFKNFLFGGQVLAYTDIGSDTAAQYLMHYQTIINHLRDGSFSLWDFHNGVGINMFSLNLFDPFLLLLYGLGVLLGSEQIYGILVYMQILRMVLAGLVLYGYLSCFRLSEPGKVIGAYLYTFSGFMVVWGQHYQFGTIAILFPLLLLMVEKALKKRQWHLGVTVACALVSLCSMYFGYMQLMALGFYVLFRVAWEEKFFSKSGLKRIGAIYGSMILGIGMGMFQLLPSAMMIFGVSDRMEGDSLLTRVVEAMHPYDGAYYKTLFLRFFSSNLQGTNEFSGYQNYYEAPNVFFSVLFVIVAVQFVFLVFFTKNSAVSNAEPSNESPNTAITKNGNNELSNTAITKNENNEPSNTAIIKNINDKISTAAIAKNVNNELSNTVIAKNVNNNLSMAAGTVNVKQKRILGIACLTGVFLLLVPLGSLIFNGFAYPFSRHTFVCMPFFALMVAWVLDRMLLEHKGSRKLLVLAAFLGIGVYGTICLMEKSKLAFLLTGLTVVMNGTLWYLMKKNHKNVSEEKIQSSRCFQKPSDASSQLNISAKNQSDADVSNQLSINLENQSNVIVSNRYKRNQLILFAVFCFSIMGTMILDSYFSYSHERGVLEAAPSEYMEELYDSSVQEALAYLEKYDDSFYRVEKDYNVGNISDCLNALAQGYDGISTYNSTLNGNTAEFYKQLWPNMIFVNDDHFSFTNGKMDTFQASLLNVKYVLSKSGDFSAPGYTLLKQFDTIYLYENTMTSEPGKFYHKVITEETFEKEKDSLNQSAVLSEYLICDTLPEYTETDFKVQDYTETDFAVQNHAENDFAVQDYIGTDFINQNYAKKDITEEAGVSVVQNGGVTENVTIETGTTEISFEVNGFWADSANMDQNAEGGSIYRLEFDLQNHFGGRIYADAAGILTNLCSEEEIYHVSLVLPEHCSSVKIYDEILKEEATFQIENVKLYKEMLPDLTSLSDGISISQPEKDSLVTGTANVSEAGVLMLAIPYEDGWHAYVDGEETEIHKVNYGFSGIFLEAGEHTIRMEYKCPGFAAGVCCSIFFLLLTAAIWCCIVRKEKSSKRVHTALFLT